ncbi:MAG: hypothetical protein EOM73_17715 [Bacteroidia bacterium]|nr:hypothetical protein [Bacteroidia bacterium]
MKEIKIKITGTTPLICNRFTEDAQIAADDVNPEKEAEKKLYIGKDGNPMLPQFNLLKAFINAGWFFRIEGCKVTTRKKSLIPACVEIEGLEIPIRSKDGWEADTRAVRIRSSGRRIFSHRPKFNDWELEFTVHFDEEIMNAELFRKIVDTAGKCIGLGDFRPERKGPFGKFTVSLWEEKQLQKGHENE